MIFVIFVYIILVVSYKPVAEVLKIGIYTRGWLLGITDGRTKLLMDRKVLEVSSFSLFFSDYLPTYLFIDLSIYLSLFPFIYLLSFYLFVFL